MSDVQYAAANIGHPDTLLEEWFRSDDAAETLRRRLSQNYQSATMELACQSVACVTIMHRKPPRQFAGVDKLVASVRDQLDGMGISKPTVELEMFDNRSFAEQFAVMQRTTVLFAPHGAGLVNSAFMPRCSVVIEAYPCGLPIPFYGTLAWNSGKLYLPVYPSACGPVVGGSVDVLRCINDFNCRARARHRPVNLSALEAHQLLDEAFALHRACRMNMRVEA